MRSQLQAEVVRRGVISRRTALALVPEHVLDDALADGVLVRIFPGVYVPPGRAIDRDIRRVGALIYRPRTAIGAIDALDLWGAYPFNIPENEPIHLIGGPNESFPKCQAVQLHKRSGFVRKPPHVWEQRGGAAIGRIEQAIVDSWTMLPKRDHRVPVIVAVRERKTTGNALLEVLAANKRAQGAAEMRHVFRLVAEGCHSPLELWGHENVFSHPSLPRSECQVPMEVLGRTIYLDRYYAAERLAVELDGAAYHGQPGQRERDIRRDAAVATFGIQTIRFSHPRIFGDPEGVRAEVLAILAARRRQFGLPV